MLAGTSEREQRGQQLQQQVKPPCPKLEREHSLTLSVFVVFGSNNHINKLTLQTLVSQAVQLKVFYNNV